MPVTGLWYRDVLFVFFYDDDGAIYDNIQPSAWSDRLGRSAEFSMGYRGVHVWDTPGTKTVTCFAYNTTNNTWQEATIVVTVQDPLTVFPQANRYIVAADGDYTGAPAADNFYTSYLAAIEAAKTADEDCLVLVKRGQTYPVSGLTVNGPAFRELTANWHIDAWGTGAKPKIVCDFGGSPQGSTFTILHVLIECASFTLANLHFTGLYNSSVSAQVIEGVSVPSGTSGGAGNSQDVEIIYAGFGSSGTSQTASNNVTMYNCRVERVGKAFYSAGGDNHSVYNCLISEWADYGVFHTYTHGFSMVGTSAKVRSDCLHLGGAKIYDAIPREPFHGPLRSSQSIDCFVYNNDAYAKNGWYSDDTCQPPLRIHSDGARENSPNISVICSRNLCSNGDGPIIFVPANGGVPSQFTDDALFDGNVLIGQQHQYDGYKIAQAGVFRNTMAIQEDGLRESPNDVWQSVFLCENSGATNGTDPNVFLQQLDFICSTIINNLSAQSSTYPWAAISNAAELNERNRPGFPNADLTNKLSYAPALSSTTENQVDPVFDSNYVPSAVGFVNTETRIRGSILDIYGNIRPLTCNLGAVQDSPNRSN